MKINRKCLWMMIVLTVLALAVGAFADDKLYTSGTFRIPADQLEEEAPPEEQGSEPEGTVPEETIPQETIPEGTPSEETVPEGTVPEEILPGEEGEPLPEGEEGQSEQEDSEAAEDAEPLPPEQRVVSITSSRQEHITAGEPVYLESHLEGFGNLPVTYRWQVDKNDGMGWQDVGSNRSYHVFVATAESVQYSWRLIVDVEE